MYIDFKILSESMCVELTALGDVKTNKPQKDWVSLAFKEGLSVDDSYYAVWDNSEWLKTVLLPYLDYVYTYSHEHNKEAIPDELSDLDDLLQKTGSNLSELKEMFDKARELEFI